MGFFLLAKKKKRERAYDSLKQLELAKIITREVKVASGATTDKIVLNYGCCSGLIGLEIADRLKRTYLFIHQKDTFRLVILIKMKKLVMRKSITDFHKLC
ncbi:hypothetical protein IGJ34_000688 [Enterococcus sp. AZ177]